MWGGMGDDKKLHLVSWNQVCRPLMAGGLGIRNVYKFNQALMGKWLWRYATEREALWHKIIKAKYEYQDGGWCSKEVSGPYGVGLWKHIRRGCDTFSMGVRFEVGIGSKVRFWHDVWCSDQLLKLVFPSLFSISRYKEAWVKENFIWRIGIVEWNVIFVRSVQDWEVDVVSSFFEKLYSCKISHGNEDCIHCSPSKKGTFEVKMLYKALFIQNYEVFPWKSIWHSKGPPRVACFGWTAALGKILTHDNLRKRNIVVVEWCCMCKKNGESVDHLLAMEFCLYVVWCGMGYAAKISRLACLLELGGGVGIFLKVFGEWCLYTSHGVFGGRGMPESLRIRSVRWMG
jgi:hypothetical protein